MHVTKIAVKIFDNKIHCEISHTSKNDRQESFAFTSLINPIQSPKAQTKNRQATTAKTIEQGNTNGSLDQKTIEYQITLSYWWWYRKQCS